MAFAALARFAAQGASVDVVHAQARHHIGLSETMKFCCPLVPLLAPGFAHDDVGDDDVALHVHKAPPWARFQPGNQGHGGAGALFARSTAFGVQACVRRRTSRPASISSGCWQICSAVCTTSGGTPLFASGRQGARAAA